MQVFAWPPSLWIVLETINRVCQTILLLPAQASTIAAHTDALQYFELTIYTLISVVYMGATVYFLLRFRRRSGDDAPEVTAPRLVMGYAFGMFAIFSVFWYIGYVQFKTIRTAPARATDVYVTAKQWTWEFAYTQGGASVDVLYVPVHQPIRLLLTSRDVIHSFWVPAFRLKQDVVPGTYNTLWFEATTPGAYQVMCAQMCGPGHARMWAQIVVLGPNDYERWRRGAPPEVSRASVGLAEPLANDSGPRPFETPAAMGQRAAAQFACLKCHTLDGQPHIGPSWLGLYGSQELMQDGSRVTVDEAYITESMMDPAARIVNGFQPVMPSYQGIVAPADTAAIIEFMKSLRNVQQPHVVAPLPAGPIDGIAIRPRGARP